MPKFRISRALTEFYVIEAKTEEEALEILSYGDIDAMDKEYWGEENIREIKHEVN
jgi:hypothetical protein